MDAPTVMPCPLSLSYPGPRSNTAQLFEGNRSLRALGFLNKVFADNMVHIGPEPALFAGETSQTPLDRSRSYRLKNGAAFGVPRAFGFDDLSAETLCVRGGGYFDDAEVNPQHVVHQRLVALWNVAGRQQIEFPIEEIAFAPLIGQHSSVGTSDAVRDAGCGISDAGYRMRDTGCGIGSSESPCPSGHCVKREGALRNISARHPHVSRVLIRYVGTIRPLINCPRFL